jgi:hypothetical protein
MSALRGVLLAMTLVASPACITPSPPYVFAPGEAKAQVVVVEDGRDLSLIKDGKVYSVKLGNGTKSASLPATGPILLGRFLYYTGYQVSYSCLPMAAFTPEPGVTYVMDVVIIDDACLAQVVREDTGTRTGVSLEPTAEELRQ